MDTNKQEQNLEIRCVRAGINIGIVGAAVQIAML